MQQQRPWSAITKWKTCQKKWTSPVIQTSIRMARMNLGRTQGPILSVSYAEENVGYHDWRKDASLFHRSTRIPCVTFSQLNNFLVGLANDSEAILKSIPKDISRQDLHTASDISRHQHEADNWDAVNNVEEDRARREKAVKMIGKTWGKWPNSMALAMTVINLFGRRLGFDPNKIVKACEPERALYLLNGELITGLRERRAGRRTDRSLTPSDFANVIKVLDGKIFELAWDMSDAREFNLRFNKIGMLSGDYTSLSPYKENVVLPL